MRRLLLGILARTVVRIVLVVSLICLAMYADLYLEMTQTQPSHKPHNQLITGPAPGQTWPSPLPFP